MKLKNMQITAAEQKERHERMAIPSGDYPSFSSRYPYGLELRLDEEALDKLGLDKLPPVGKRVRIEAVGVVTSARVNEQREMKGDKGKIVKHRNVEIQLQKIGLSTDPQSAEDAVDDALEDMDG